MAAPHESDQNDSSAQSNDGIHRHGRYNMPISGLSHYRPSSSPHHQGQTYETYERSVPSMNTPSLRPYAPSASSSDMLFRFDLSQAPPFGMSNEARRQNIMAMDRKRRLTGSTQDNGRRRHGLPGFHDHNAILNRLHETPASSSRSERIPSTALLPSDLAASSSAADVIDLTHSPLSSNTELPFGTANRPPASSPSIYAVPRWQPDSEASECPICNRSFTFLFRRHHCRKCGRVVCNDCSPHRITIPRQFIVNPPGVLNSEFYERGEAVELTEDEDEDAAYPTTVAASRRQVRSFLHVGGGAKVRLCNPCVPDPQPNPQSVYSPTSSTTHLPASQSYSVAERGVIGRPPSIATQSGVGRPSSRTLPSISNQRFAISGPQFPPSRSTRNHASTFDSFAIPPSGMLAHAMPAPGSERFYDRTDSPISSRHPGHSRYHSFDDHHRPLLSSSTRPRGQSMWEEPPPLVPGYRTSAPVFHRQVNEDDICPVCRRLLPARGPNDDEAAREAHIVDCINQRDSSNHASVRSLGLVQAPSRGPVHMLTFIATEKDCVGEEGTTQECSICMVEYDVGDQLARLECLCKFHRECIVSWFERKQECPVHKVA